MKHLLRLGQPSYLKLESLDRTVINQFANVPEELPPLGVRVGEVEGGIPPWSGVLQQPTLQ